MADREKTKRAEEAYPDRAVRVKSTRAYVPTDETAYGISPGVVVKRRPRGNKKLSLLEQAQVFGLALGQGFSLNTADDVERAIGTDGDRYERARVSSPMLFETGRVVGGLANPVNLVTTTRVGQAVGGNALRALAQGANARRAADFGKRVAEGTLPRLANRDIAALGALQGGILGFGSGDEDIGTIDRAVNTGIGVATGGIMPVGLALTARAAGATGAALATAIPRRAGDQWARGVVGGTPQQMMLTGSADELATGLLQRNAAQRGGGLLPLGTGVRTAMETGDAGTELAQRLIARPEGRRAVEKRLRQVEAQLRNRVGKVLFGQGAQRRTITRLMSGPTAGADEGLADMLMRSIGALSKRDFSRLLGAADEATRRVAMQKVFAVLRGDEGIDAATDLAGRLAVRLGSSKVVGGAPTVAPSPGARNFAELAGDPSAEALAGQISRNARAFAATDPEMMQRAALLSVQRADASALPLTERAGPTLSRTRQPVMVARRDVDATVDALTTPRPVANIQADAQAALPIRQGQPSWDWQTGDRLLPTPLLKLAKQVKMPGTMLSEAFVRGDGWVSDRDPIVPFVDTAVLDSEQGLPIYGDEATRNQVFFDEGRGDAFQTPAAQGATLEGAIRDRVSDQGDLAARFGGDQARPYDMNKAAPDMVSAAARWEARVAQITAETAAAQERVSAAQLRVARATTLLRRAETPEQQAQAQRAVEVARTDLRIARQSALQIEGRRQSLAQAYPDEARAAAALASWQQNAVQLQDAAFAPLPRTDVVRRSAF